MSSIHIVCPHCHSRNRLPADRLHHHPRCGVCKQGMFAGKPVDLDDQCFDAHISGSDIPVVVDFWASWCGPCRALAPAYAQAASQLEPAMQLTKVNVDEAQQTAARFGIRSIPTLVVFRNGKEVARQAGALPAPQLQAWLKQWR